MSDLLEALMIICFGLSWPISIRKSYTARTAKGQSLFFEIFLLVGYIFGVVRKAAFPPETKNWLYWLALCAYCFNFLAISIDVGLYFRNTKLDKIAAQTKN